MTSDKNSYYARVRQDSNSIQISEGGKPVHKNGFSRYIEVYLPVSYQNNLTVTSSNGPIDLSGVHLNLSNLRIDSSSGSIQLDKVAAKDIHLSSTSGAMNLGKLSGETIRLETTSGNISCGEISGYVTYTSTSGNGEFRLANGSGCYRNENSGELTVAYTEVNGDLSLSNKNGATRLTLPSGLEFQFEARTKNGSVSTTFQEYVTAQDDTTSGTVGNAPSVRVSIESKNGDIEVIR